MRNMRASQLHFQCSLHFISGEAAVADISLYSAKLKYVRTYILRISQRSPEGLEATGYGL